MSRLLLHQRDQVIFSKVLSHLRRMAGDPRDPTRLIYDSVIWRTRSPLLGIRQVVGLVHGLPEQSIYMLRKDS